MRVLTLDLARRTGWALGDVGSKQPRSGSVSFGTDESSHEATFGNALTWANEKFPEFAPTLIVWESPLAPSFKRGETNIGTTAILFGLPAIIGAVAYLLKITARQASVQDVRKFFLGSNPKRGAAKHLTMMQCRAHGWTVEDDNEADACALWSYTCSILDPKLAPRTSPLFHGRA